MGGLLSIFETSEPHYHYARSSHQPQPQNNWITPTNNNGSTYSIRKDRTYAYSPSLSSAYNVYRDYNVSPLPTPRRNNFPSVRRTSKTIISNADYQRYQQILCSAVLREATVLKWNVTTNNVNYKLVPLVSYTSEYYELFNKFMKGISGNEIHVIKIERIENPYLLGQYLIKKLEYKNKQLSVAERIMFHGTKREHVNSICADNFDWRLHGTTKGNIFGKGVSFTPKSSYANHYCDRKDAKVMIVVKVLVSRTCAGNQHMTLPGYIDNYSLLRYDTSIKEPKKDVFVKYCDDEFYPAYLIHYVGKIFYPNKGFFR